MTNESYDFCNLWLLKFMKYVIYDFCNYDKRIMKNIFMTKVLWLLLLRPLFNWKLRYTYIQDFRGIKVKSVVLSSHCSLAYTPAFRQFEHLLRDKHREFSALYDQLKVNSIPLWIGHSLLCIIETTLTVPLT